MLPCQTLHARIPHVAFTHNTYAYCIRFQVDRSIRVAALCMRQDRESCCPSVYVYIHANSACSQLCLILREERLACYALVGSAIFRWVGGSGQDSTLVTRPSSFPFYHALLYAKAILTPMPQVESVYNERAVQHVYTQYTRAEACS